MLLRRLPIALLAASTFASAACAAPAERRFPVTGFDRVAASGSEDVTILTGKAASVVATGPQAKLDRLEVDVEDSTLRIRQKSGMGWSWSDREDVRIVITMPALHAVRGSGSGDITADSGSGPAFEAALAGSGDMRISRINSPSVTLRTAGSGDITASGQCTNAKVSISGSGDMQLADLACTNVDIGISGSGDVAARATGTANVRISGSGDVTVTGGARCTSRTSGSGTVNCG
ncbi:head GIN domain-containing protein [Polymorphobacter fuscus]|uniref:DUF4097 family beta strand repeat protein n=1 Tax=Sandarakinorhabdus fusca TaxID=1439888 RepID=A0A7C9KX82_9SPHN|nr:head GIN domain-containing protein [Polymorphobacter fuscus]KAB7647486.1 DUF2807 domain-containing protein [Polymorphobacter fuscus]MQT16746.1 DUF4097 family beta strand repeat protein [Polymorphobacter fuscus]NJC09266.1 hypothetical protein [Polymorphobacter fuscus]